MSRIPFLFLCVLCSAEDFYYTNYNISRTTLNGISAYRSALTLDWLAAEDSRQREMVAVFETEASAPPKVIGSECISYPRPSPGKIARLMLELLKNLEGDEGVVVPDLIQALVKTKLLFLETSVFDAEPDFDALVKTPHVMMGEPHSTFPRILAMVWMSVTDPSNRMGGWCSITKVTKYISSTRPNEIAKNMHALDPIIARARFVMEEFIQHMTPLNMMHQKQNTPPSEPKAQRYMKPMLGDRSSKMKRPKIRIQTDNLREPVNMEAKVQPLVITKPSTAKTTRDYFNDDVSMLDDGTLATFTIWSIILPFTLILL